MTIKTRTVFYTVKDVGSLVRSRFHGSLHVFSDEAQRAGIRFPSGLIYIGPVGRGLFKPVDEGRLEVVLNPERIDTYGIETFLRDCDILPVSHPSYPDGPLP